MFTVSTELLSAATATGCLLDLCSLYEHPRGENTQMNCKETPKRRQRDAKEGSRLQGLGTRTEQTERDHGTSEQDTNNKAECLVSDGLVSPLALMIFK